jgi:CRP-like cAMP-binding protein
MDTLQRILTSHPFFEGMWADHLQIITGCASNVRFEEGDYIFRQGEEANHFFLIRQGKVSKEISPPQSEPLIVQTLEEGDILGWSWLVPPYQWKYDARATTMTRAIALDGACLRNKCEHDRELGYELLKRFSLNVSRTLDATILQLMDVYATYD